MKRGLLIVLLAGFVAAAWYWFTSQGPMLKPLDLEDLKIWTSKVPQESPLSMLRGALQGGQPWDSLLERLSPDEAAELLHEEELIRKAKEPLLLQNRLLAVWVRKDPSEVIHFLEAQPDSQSKELGAIAAICAWAEQDRGSALAYLRQLPESNVKAQSIHRIFVFLAQKDPKKAVTLLRDNFPEPERDTLTRFLYSMWAQKDLISAWEEVPPGFDADHRKDLIGIILNIWATRDPAKAWAQAEQLADKSEREYARVSVISGWAQIDLKSATDAAWKLPRDQGRAEAIYSVIHRAIFHQPSMVSDLMNQLLDDPDKKTIIQRVGGDWVLQDPASAVPYLLGLPKDSDQSKIIADAAKALAKNSPDSAIDLAMNLEGRPRELALKEIFNQWSISDPLAAFERLAEPESKELRPLGLEPVGWRLAEKDPAAALALGSRLSEGSERRSYLVHVLGSWAKSDPQAAVAAWRGLSDSGAKAAAIPLMAEQWAMNAPKDVVDWLRPLEDNTLKASAMWQVFFRWASKDPAAAAETLNSLSPGPGRDSAINGLVAFVQQEDPIMAIRWALTMKDAGNGQSRTYFVYEAWHKKDPMAARAWLSSADLPDEFRKRLERLP
jgi:hypothetical protein